jgi:serine/threonine protein kinase
MQRVEYGRYELLRKLAAGGMAEIFLARQWAEGGFFRDVVIKRLFPHMAEHRRTLEMFQYEARLLAHLSHPSIPQAYELAFVDGRWYIAMEYVDGHTVADVLRGAARTGHWMPLPCGIGIVLQMCEALHHAHERRDRAGIPLRIVHRDVTPHNVMVTRDGVAKVMDFGVAQTAARRDTEAGAVKGTFSYMAPEQVRARPLDKRADVFALGVILYELTTGTRLYRGTDVQVMTSIVEHDAPRPSARVEDYPLDLEEVVMAALERDRSRRLPSAAHLAMALEDFAVRHGLFVGPRALGRYFQTVFPYESTREEAVAMVESQEPVTFAIGGDLETYSLDEGGSAIDDASLAEDLALLAPDDEQSYGADDVPIALDLPPSQRPSQPGLWIEETTETGLPEAGLVEEIDSPLALSGFDEERGERPVVLLDAPKREGPRDNDYLRDLERRLEVEDADD